MSLPLFQTVATKANTGLSTYTAATQIAFYLSKGVQISSKLMSEVMTEATGGSDASGAWTWKDAYDAGEIALSLYARRTDALMALLETSPIDCINELNELQSKMPTQTKRSDEQQAMDQFSTPLGVAALVNLAMRPRTDDIFLEPSAGTGMIAAMASSLGAKVHCNELSDIRRNICQQLMKAEVTDFDGKLIGHLHPLSGTFTGVIMNPPFTNVTAHLTAALSALRPGGRLATITYSSDSVRKSIAASMAGKATPLLIMKLPDQSFRKHGTTAPTDLLVYEKTTSQDGSPVICAPETLEEACDYVSSLPKRANSTQIAARVLPNGRALKSGIGKKRTAIFQLPSDVREVKYTGKEWKAPSSDSTKLYAVYDVPRILIEDAGPHPTALVQSAPMASLCPPLPTYVPLLPTVLLDKKALSGPQLETLIYAGQAHSEYISGRFVMNEKNAHDLEYNEAGRQYRRGFFCGDGTGVGKGRQASAIIMDGLAHGRVKHIWISKNEALMEDAKRDWVSLGGAPTDIHSLGTWQANDKIPLERGILFVTYGCLRQGATGNRRSRVDQIVEWATDDFDGAIIIDESHALGNATATKDESGKGMAKNASQQALAGIALQNKLPEARITYFSATGAESVENFAYTTRLGLWGSPEAPFIKKETFIATIGNGGVSALEILSRDLYSLGLYIARNLSFEGVEYEQLVHSLTDYDKHIYDTWADAWRIILDNLNQVMALIGIENDEKTDSRAKAAALSAFYSAQQRFFNHLILSIQTPSVVKFMEEKIAEGHCCVVQIVSTNEAVMERRLNEISPSEWSNIQVNLTPVEYVKDYLDKAFPVHVRETVADESGNVVTQLATHNGETIVSAEAEAIKQDLMERISDLPAQLGALDQIIQYFGTQKVAEITGRSRRIVKRGLKLAVETRNAHAALNDANAFAASEKDILIFSDAGGTGRSYHADAGIENQRRRIHILLEPGWSSKVAIQGLGRTHRTNQVSAPLFVPVTTTIEGQKRFISTIAKRLEALGAATRGERKTGGQNLFKPEDAIEGPYATAALTAFYQDIYRGTLGRPSEWDKTQVWEPKITLSQFEDMLGLKLQASDGEMVKSTPPLTRFLSRILALRVEDQNYVFNEFLTMLQASISAARSKGTLDMGLEDIKSDQISIVTNDLLTTDSTGAETRLVEVSYPVPSYRMTYDQARMEKRLWKGIWVKNTLSGKVGLQSKATDWLVGGERVPSVCVQRPTKRQEMALADYEASHWEPIDAQEVEALWDAEVEVAPISQERSIYLVCGLLLNFWKNFSGSDDFIKIRRAKTLDGQTFLGRVIEGQKALTLKQTYCGLTPTSLTPEQVYSAVMAFNQNIQLVDGMVLSRSRVALHDRFELNTHNYEAKQRLIAMGAFTETINWQRRFFLPLDNAIPILTRILASNPIAQVD